VLVKTKKQAALELPAVREKAQKLNVGLGLAQTLDAIAFLPLAALLEERDALEALEDIAFDDETAAGFETVVLGHRGLD
jgi:hypothetical protein